MMTPTNPLYAAGQFQRIAQQESNPKLAFTVSTMTVVLLGILLAKELSHCVREQLREHDRRQPGLIDRRR